MRPLRFLLVSTIAVIMIHEGETTKCWTCHSFAQVQAGCSDPFLGSADVKSDAIDFIRECGKDEHEVHFQFLPNGTERTQYLNPGLKFFCYKITGTSLGVKVVMRGCASRLSNIAEGSCMDSEPEKTIRGNILTCDVCAGDLCNGAASVGAVAVLLAPLLLLFTYSQSH